MENKVRNHGIDLLRIVSMLMVLILHILGPGGILKNTNILSANYEAAWLLEIAAFCAVNCYALASGYVGLYTKFKYTNIVHIWLQVAFYNVLFTAIAAALLPEVTSHHILEACLPVHNNFYWYFTAYFVVFFISPLLNRAVLALSNKQMCAIAITIFILFSVGQTLKSGDIFFINNGYSALWLSLLYVLGAIIRKNNIAEKIKTRTAFLGYAACVLLTWGYKYAAEYHNLTYTESESWPVFSATYIFPTILISAIFLVIAFSQLHITKFSQRLISFFAPLSFGVYLIHAQRYLWRYLLSERFTRLASQPSVSMVIYVFMFAVLLFIICAFTDFIRDRLFRLLHIREILTKLEVRFFGNLWTQQDLEDNNLSINEKA